MSTTHEVFELWRDANGLSSDRQTALALGLDPSTITLWKRGRNGSPAVIARMARDLGLDVPTTVIRAHMETVADRADRAVWTEIASRAQSDPQSALAASTHRRPIGKSALRNSMKPRAR
jgi:transcriptional regulator with XRE-family HTH domain